MSRPWRSYWLEGTSLAAGSVALPTAPVDVLANAADTVQFDFTSIIARHHLLTRPWAVIGLAFRRHGVVTVATGTIESIAASGLAMTAAGIAGGQGALVGVGGDELSAAIPFTTPFLMGPANLRLPIPGVWRGYVRVRWRNYSGATIKGVVGLAVGTEEDCT